MEVIKFDVEAVDTHREKPAVSYHFLKFYKLWAGSFLVGGEEASQADRRQMQVSVKSAAGITMEQDCQCDLVCSVGQGAEDGIWVYCR